MSAPKPAVGDSGNLTNWPNKLFFLNSLFELLFFLVLQRVKSARDYCAEPQNQERSTRKQERRSPISCGGVTEAAFENSVVGVVERRELK